MEQFALLKGKIVKGRDLKSLGLQWCKVTNETMIHHGFEWKIGSNTDVHDLTIEKCSQGGLYFCPMNVLYDFHEYGNGYHYVDFADDEDIFVEHKKCKAKTIILGKKHKITEIPLEMCKSMLEKNGEYIPFMSDEIKNNPDLCRIALNQNGSYILYMGDEIKNNVDLCKIAVKHDGRLILHMSDEIKNNPDVCKIAVSENPFSIKYMSNEIKNNVDVCKTAVSMNFYSLGYMSHEIKNNPDLWKIAVSNDIRAIKCIPESMRNNPKIYEDVKSIDYEFIASSEIPIDIKTALLTGFPLMDFQTMPKKLRYNRHICKTFVARDGMLIEHMNQNVRKHIDVCRIAVTQNKDAAQFISRVNRKILIDEGILDASQFKK